MLKNIKFILTIFLLSILLSIFLFADATFSTAGTVTITTAGTYQFTGAGNYTVNFNLPANACNKKITELELIGGGGGGGGGWTYETGARSGGSGTSSVFAGINAGGGTGGTYGYDSAAAGAGGSGGIPGGTPGDNWNTTTYGGGNGGIGWHSGGNASTGGNGCIDIYGASYYAGGLYGSGYGGGGGLYGGGGGSGGIILSNNEITILNNMQLVIGSGGTGGARGYTSAALYGGAGGRGSSGYAKLVVTFDTADITTPTDDTYYLEDSNENRADLDYSSYIYLVREYANDPGKKIGQIGLNMNDLGLTVENDFTDLVIDTKPNGNPYVYVPSTSDLASVVNSAGGTKWVPIKLGPFNKKPVIKYKADGSEDYLQITDINGAPLSGVTNVRNYSFAENYVTFEVNHFSSYGAAELSSVIFANSLLYGDLGETYTITVNVKDTDDDIVENAPVTFSYVSGTGGTLENKGLVVSTNAEGIATINFTMPASDRTTHVIKAEVDGVFSYITIKVPGALTASEQLAYDAWALANGVVGSQLQDDDGDGVPNLLEWNYGVDSTNPNDPDTDNDSINDKWDAYPNDNSKTVFNSDYTAATVNAQTFSGSAKGAVVLAVSSNLVINTTVDTGYSKNATQDSIIDDSRSVLEINGLAFESVRDGNLAFASGNYSEDLYRSLYPNETYSVLLTYLNRGNDTDTLTANVELVQTDNRWSVQYGNSGLTGVAPWQLASLEVMVLPTSALAYEKTTLNIDLGYAAGEARLVTSYNAFTGAYLGNSYNSAGAYGGLESFAYTFQLEAQGFELKVVSRSIEITPPPNYTGVSVSAGEMVPGTKIKYYISVQNESFSRAPSINLKDTIPNNCHLFYDDLPEVVNAEAWEWKSATSNFSAVDDIVFFEISIPARETVTCSYTVTLD